MAGPELFLNVNFPPRMLKAEFDHLTPEQNIEVECWVEGGEWTGTQLVLTFPGLKFIRFEIVDNAPEPIPDSVVATSDGATASFIGRPGRRRHWFFNFVVKPLILGPIQIRTQFTVTNDIKIKTETTDFSDVTYGVDDLGQGQVPDLPFNTACFVSGPKSILVRWDFNPANTDHIVIQAIKQGGGPEILSGKINASLKEWLLESDLFDADTLYDVKFRSFNQYGQNPAPPNFGAAAVGRTSSNPPAPSVPVGLVAQTVSESQVKLTFTASPDIVDNGITYETTYKALYATAPGGPYTEFVGEFILPTITVTGLSPNTTYYFVIRAMNDGGESANSAEVSATTYLPGGIPSVPTSLTSSVICGSATINWLPPASGRVDGYRVYRSLSPNDPLFERIAQLPATVRSYTDATLGASTTRRYKITAFNTFGESAGTAIIDITTSAADATPTTPTNLVAQALSNTKILLVWTNSATTERAVEVYRSLASGGPFTKVATLAQDATEYTDTSLSPATTYYYVVKATACGSESDLSNQANATTTSVPIAQSGVASDTFDPDANVSVMFAAQRTIYLSDLNRPIININDRFYKMGLKPQLVAPTLTNNSSDSNGLVGDFVAYIGLWREDGGTPSMLGPVSSTLTVASGSRLKVVPELIGASTKVQCRDKGTDISGLEIDGATHWQVFLQEASMRRPVLMATLPLTTVEYITPSGLKLADLSNHTRQPAFVGFEFMIPPACWRGEFYGNRLHLQGERTIKPTEAQQKAGAQITIVNGTRTVTFSNFEATDALIRKRLFVNDGDTTWFIVDVVDSTTAIIAHSDPAIHRLGFNGSQATNIYTSFSFPGRRSAIYRSAYLLDIEGNEVFSIECFPTNEIQEGELQVDDNQDPNGAKASRDSMYIFKPSKIFIVRGGYEPSPDGFETLSITPISRGCGLAAPRSMASNREDEVFIMSDVGPTKVRPSGAEQIGVIGGNAYMFRDYFRADTLKNARAAWFFESDYYIVTCLDRIGFSGGRHGLIYDDRTKYALPFRTSFSMTALCVTHTNNNRYQMLAGDELGRLIGFLADGQQFDLVDLTAVQSDETKESIEAIVTSGIVRDSAGCSIRAFIPAIEQEPGILPATCTVEFDSKRRTSMSRAFDPEITKTFTTLRAPNHVTVRQKRMQAWQMRFRVTPPAGETIRWHSMRVITESEDYASE